MDKEKLQNLINQNKSITDLALHFEKSKSTIRYWLKKFDLKTSYISKDVNKHYVCTKCNLQLSELDFYKKNDKYYHTYCKSCFNKQVLQRQNEIKIQAIVYKGGECEHCGYSKYIGALEFHHIDPKEKDINWKNFKLRKFNSNFKKELDKCKLLCANCHREEHNNLHLKTLS